MFFAPILPFMLCKRNKSAIHVIQTKIDTTRTLQRPKKSHRKSNATLRLPRTARVSLHLSLIHI